MYRLEFICHNILNEIQISSFHSIPNFFNKRFTINIIHRGIARY